MRLPPPLSLPLSAGSHASATRCPSPARTESRRPVRAMAGTTLAYRGQAPRSNRAAWRPRRRTPTALSVLNPKLSYRSPPPFPSFCASRRHLNQATASLSTPCCLLIHPHRSAAPHRKLAAPPTPSPLIGESRPAPPFPLPLRLSSGLISPSLS
jgi:hypothetical protein